MRGVQAPPTMEALDKVTVERVEIYRCSPPKSLRVPLLVRKAKIEDGIPMESEVAEEVRGLKGCRAGGPSGMRAEDLKEWLREATCKKDPVRRTWDLLERLLHQAFGDGTLPEDLAWATMILTQKGRGEFWVLGLSRWRVRYAKQW